MLQSKLQLTEKQSLSDLTDLKTYVNQLRAIGERETEHAETVYETCL